MRVLDACAVRVLDACVIAHLFARSERESVDRTSNFDSDEFKRGKCDVSLSITFQWLALTGPESYLCELKDDHDEATSSRSRRVVGVLHSRSAT